MSDGPHGVRHEISKTSWNRRDVTTITPPTSHRHGAGPTWNRSLMAQAGAVLGAEAHIGQGLILGRDSTSSAHRFAGATLSITARPLSRERAGRPGHSRHPGTGRRRLRKALRRQQPGAQPHGTDVEMDERTLRELYLPGFEAAVRDGGVLTVMELTTSSAGNTAATMPISSMRCSKRSGSSGRLYQRLGGSYSTERLRAAAPTSRWVRMSPPLTTSSGPRLSGGLRSGLYPEAELDDKVRRTLRVMYLPGYSMPIARQVPATPPSTTRRARLRPRSYRFAEKRWRPAAA